MVYEEEKEISIVIKEKIKRCVLFAIFRKVMSVTKNYVHNIMETIVSSRFVSLFYYELSTFIIIFLNETLDLSSCACSPI
jgi:hypothetical protein